MKHKKNSESKKTEKAITQFTRRGEEVDKRFDKFVERFDKLAQKYGGLSDNIGESVAEFFSNALEQNPVIGDTHFDRVVRNMKSEKVEYDIVLINGKYIALVEVKHKFHPNDVEKFVKKSYTVNFQIKSQTFFMFAP